MKKVIACGIFKPYINELSFQGEQYVFHYLDIHQHNQPQKLAKAIQSEINQTIGFDKIIILYAVCGGALFSLKAVNIPLVLIRVHDCMSILLGSKEKYEQLTAQTKSISWSCYSLKQENYKNESLSDWEMLYDEETVAYLKTILLQNEDLYISLDLPQEKPYLEQEKRVIKGNLQFLNDILLLDSKELLYMYPHQKIKQSLDSDVFDIVSDSQMKV